MESETGELPNPEFPPRLWRFQAGLTDFHSEFEGPRDLLVQVSHRLDSWKNQLHTFAAMILDAVRRISDASTRIWGAGRPPSSINGIPVDAKNVTDTVDLPTEFGRAAFWHTAWDVASKVDCDRGSPDLAME